MINSAQINYSEQMTLGCQTANASLEIVKSLFYDKEQYEIHYAHRDIKDISLEINLDSVLLICLFDCNLICESVFFYPDHKMDINHYIEYCDKTYPRNIIPKGWVINNLLIQTNTNDEEAYLLILPIKEKLR